jgi:hypothetical protein
MQFMLDDTDAPSQNTANTAATANHEEGDSEGEGLPHFEISKDRNSQLLPSRR